MYHQPVMLKECIDALSRAELKIKELSKDVEGKIELQDFE